MQTRELDFAYPQELIALQPSRPTRVAFVRGEQPVELTMDELITQFRPGDLLVLNESKVIPARIFSLNETEILFLRPLSERLWQVLFPARDLKLGDALDLPGGVKLTLTEKGLPQTIEVSHPLDATYFAAHGEVALPPYIQEARGERHNRPEDQRWYQTAWAREPGSVAAPTASLHFTDEHIGELRTRDVQIATVILHVGAGTFLPVKVSHLTEHVMHEELATVPALTRAQLRTTKARGGRVWALGTTVARTLESEAHGLLREMPDGSAHGPTKLFIYPPYDFRTVDVLMTNFHQPKSTLLALVAAFAGLETVKKVYAWAIANRFHLFSYGDLSVWIKP